ncbi:hypothetical protein L7F22_004360 [Adiantum nelumboides]|nr:hypothetical protein [Adiantum nelumboides]
MAASASASSSSVVFHRLPNLSLRSVRKALSTETGNRLKLGWTPCTKCLYRLVDVRGRSASTTASSTARFNPKYREDRLKKLSELVEDVVRTAVDTGPRGAIRFAQGIEAVANVGGGWALDQLKNLSTSRSADSGLPFSIPGPLQLRKLFERLGATYVKLGQFIASTPSLFPADYVKEFQNCLDKTPSVPFDQIKDIIREDLGRPLEDVYDHIDPVPLASASIAQI